VILGETTNSRQEVVQQLFWGEIWRKAAMVVVALLVALFATAVAVKPVEHLGASIRARPEEDLTPIPAADVPLEVVPLVDAINHHMGRIDQMIQARRRFITDAAHQLRTPLAVLNTQAEYALRQDHIGEMRAAITALHRSLGSAIRLTNQLLSLSRAEPINGLMLTRQPVDLAALARDTVIELLPLAARKSIDLGLEGTEQPVTVAGNPVLLREMLTNLIDNALRYTPSGGLVTVRVDQAGGAAPHARLYVSDTGVGIPVAQREAVFHRFFRLDSTDHSGSGLGLSIVREIVLGHGGEIHITDPQNGPGVVVAVSLPLVG
jgi:two-component system sensor histidine kinase TctE